jgi:hypothetical protein
LKCQPEPRRTRSHGMRAAALAKLHLPRCRPGPPGPTNSESEAGPASGRPRARAGRHCDWNRELKLLGLCQGRARTLAARARACQWPGWLAPRVSAALGCHSPGAGPTRPGRQIRVRLGASVSRPETHQVTRSGSAAVLARASARPCVNHRVITLPARLSLSLSNTLPAPPRPGPPGRSRGAAST